MRNGRRLTRTAEELHDVAPQPLGMSPRALRTMAAVPELDLSAIRAKIGPSRGGAAAIAATAGWQQQQLQPSSQRQTEDDAWSATASSLDSPRLGGGGGSLPPVARISRFSHDSRPSSGSGTNRLRDQSTFFSLTQLASSRACSIGNSRRSSQLTWGGASSVSGRSTRRTASVGGAPKPAEAANPQYVVPRPRHLPVSAGGALPSPSSSSTAAAAAASFASPAAAAALGFPAISPHGSPRVSMAGKAASAAAPAHVAPFAPVPPPIVTPWNNKMFSSPETRCKEYTDALLSSPHSLRPPASGLAQARAAPLSSRLDQTLKRFVAHDAVADSGGGGHRLSKAAAAAAAGWSLSPVAEASAADTTADPAAGCSPLKHVRPERVQAAAAVHGAASSASIGGAASAAIGR